MEMLRGAVGGAIPILPQNEIPLKVNIFNNAPLNNAAFIATYENIEWASPDDENYDIINYSTWDDTYAGYKLTFRVEQTVLLHSGFGTKEFIYVTNSVFDENGGIPFEIGKRYFIYGQYNNPQVTYGESDPLMLTSGECIFHPDGFEWLRMEYIQDFKYVGDDYVPTETIVEKEFDGRIQKFRCYSIEDLRVVYRPIESDLETFLTDNPDIEQWLKYAMISNASTYVRTTGQLDNIIFFNQKKAWVAEGREFTKKEMEEGSPVALIHSRFAEYNGLRVGNKITLDLYETKYHVDRGRFEDNITGINERDTFRGAVEVEIIGIYVAPDYGWEPYAIPINTIIIPDRAVPIARDRPPLPEKSNLTADIDFEYLWENYYDLDEAYIEEIGQLINDEDYFIWDSPHIIPALFAAVIQNGKMQEFMAEAREAGVGKYLLAYDQGYGAVQEPMLRLVETAQIMMIIALVLLAVIGLVLAVLTLRERHELGLFLSLGMKPARTVVQHTAGWLVLVIPALVIGAAVTVLSFNALSEYTLERVVAQDNYNDHFSSGSASESVTNQLTSRFESGGYAINIALSAGLQLMVYFIVVMAAGIVQTRRGAHKLLCHKE
jgi:hypothetical protein